MRVRSHGIVLILAVLALVAGSWSLGVADAEAGQTGCFQCKYKYFPGGEILDPWLFVYCGYTEDPGSPYDCFMWDEDTCFDWGVCGDWIAV